MRATATVQTRRIIGTVGAALLGFVLFFGDGTSPAHAVELPTWDDVQAAKQNEADAAAKVKELQGLLEQSKAELELLRVATDQANARWQDAESAAADAAERSKALHTKAAKSREEADTAASQAGVLIGQMYRSGGVNRSADMFFESDADTTDSLLNRLALMEQATRRNTTLAENAENAFNTASSLGDQAKAASEERDQLSTDAERLSQAAAENLDAQRTEFLEQEAQQRELEAQLAALTDATTDTVAGYEERLRVEEENRRKQQSGGGGGRGGGTQGGVGWYQPVPISWISTYFRQPPSHTGLDLPAGCGTPIVAPSSGTVVVAGWVDNFGGYMTYLNQDNGYQTRFAHQISTPPVAYGRWVPAGAVIGYVGNTGMSFGCHVHYEVLSGGGFIDPTPFI